MFYVYVLKSLKDKRHYIGQTNDLRDRLYRHNRGFVPATKNRIPFELVYAEEVNSRKEAMNRERYLKSLKGGKSFKRLINIGE